MPAARGSTNQHSIFNTLILDDDPLDGSRSLRKRKASSEGLDVQSKTSSKRRKRRSSGASQDDAVSQVSVPVVEEPRHETKDPEEIKPTRPKSGGASQPRPSRPARPRRPNKKKSAEPNVYTVKKTSRSFVIGIRADLSKIKLPKQKKKSQRPASSSMHQHPRFASSASQYSAPFYSLHDREADEARSKPYGGILTEAEADTSRTLPTAADRAKFDEARQKAEEEWKRKTAASEAENEPKSRTSQKVSGPPSKIKCINFGGHEIETWYAAPYPEEYSRNRVLYICEFCLKYMSSDYIAWRHKLKCPAKHPPGDEIYRDDSVSVFEVDGRKNPVYCQNLCLLAKLFLGSKTLYYDVEPFLFYIMTEYDELGCHFVGYFSKEKRPSSMNNVSCILTLPIHQRKGYGNLLIDFSYLLTRVEKKTGSPEKPLSDMGLVSYRNYWRLVLCYLLLERNEPLSITEISEATGMTADDIVAALEALRALVRDPITKKYALRLDHTYYKQCIESWEIKNYVKLNPDALVWTPYVMGRSNLATYDRAPPISTVAPREDEEEAAVAASVPAEEGVQQQQQAQATALVATASTTKESSQPILVNGATDTNPDGLTSEFLEENKITVSLPEEAINAQPTEATLQVNGGSAHPTPQPNIEPTTPLPKSPSPIPPTRYELFPPVPGTARPRRGGWRGGQKRTANNTPATMPIRRSGKPMLGRPSPANAKTNGVSNEADALRSGEVTPSGRRTRSKIGLGLELEGQAEGEIKDDAPEVESAEGAARAERMDIDGPENTDDVDQGEMDEQDDDDEGAEADVADDVDEEVSEDDEADSYNEAEDEDEEVDSAEEEDEGVEVGDEDDDDDEDLAPSRGRAASSRARQAASAPATKRLNGARRVSRRAASEATEDDEEEDEEGEDNEEEESDSEQGEEEDDEEEQVEDGNDEVQEDDAESEEEEVEDQEDAEETPAEGDADQEAEGEDDEEDAEGEDDDAEMENA